MPELTASLENYLETILNLEKKNANVKAIDIAKAISVSKASVTEALRALKGKGFINYEPYGSITLTEKGAVKAGKIAQKHEVLFDFLVNILNIDSEEAQVNACKIEHVISENVLNKLIDFIKTYPANTIKKEE